MSTRDAALYYARRGWHVIPLNWLTDDGACSCGNPDCRSQGKHPFSTLAPHGSQDSTTHLPTIRRWYKQYPRLNIGIRTGEVSGLVVVDLDGDDGLISWAEYDREEHRHQPTLLAVTGSGGLHFYFQHPSFQVANSASKIGKGIDIRGENGYIVAPPSTHKSGGQYQWDGAANPENATLSPLPGWLLPRLVPPTRAPRRSAPTEVTLPGEIPPITEGQRNVSMASIAGRLRRAGADEQHIADYLARLNMAIGDPLPQREVESVARSISRYPAGDAR